MLSPPLATRDYFSDHPDALATPMRGPDTAADGAADYERALCREHKMLAERLSDLIASGLITRKRFPMEASKLEARSACSHYQGAFTW
jgi:hypothetical protein